jgi:DNA invertase Pin-like site-specific DNA recombinase
MRAEPPTTLDVYGRVSRLGDDRMRSTIGQIEDCTAQITERGAQVGKVHTDEGRSAWNPRVRRPGWDVLMARLESGATGGVVVFDLARFSRRPIEGERLIAAAERGLLVLDSEGEYDLTSASGKKAFRDQLNAAAYESDRLSTRVKRGKKLKALAGEPNVSGRPFGFEPDGITQRQAEAAELRDIAKRSLAIGVNRESQDDIIRDLNRRGVLTAYGNPWNRASLRQVLTRARNAGHIVYDGQIVGKLPGEPILDQDTWERVCALFASRRRGRPSSDTYLCSGIAECFHCRHTLNGRPRANMKPYPDGGVRREYWCQPRADRGGCGRIAIDQREMDRHVRALTLAILADPRHAGAIEAAARQAADRRATLDTEIAELDQTATELAARLGRGEMNLKRYDAAAAPLDRRLRELRLERDDLGAPPELDAASAAAAADQSREAWSARWDAATVAERRVLIRMALRGRALIVKPLDPHAPRVFDPNRIAIED